MLQPNELPCLPLYDMWQALSLTGSPGMDMLAAGIVGFGSYVAYEELHPPVAAKKPEAAPSVGAVRTSAASAA